MLYSTPDTRRQPIVQQVHGEGGGAAGRRSRTPRHARGAARGPAVLIGSSVVVVVLIGLVLFNLDAGPGGESDTEGEERATVTPERLREDEVSDRGGDEGLERRIEVERGWIQVADDATGELAQQYRFARLDPNPAGLGPGWLEMRQPELELYLANDRMLRLTGEKAIARVPERAIESGTLTGNVLIELYENVGGRSLDEVDDDPSLVLRTPEARFDNVLGEISCPGRIDLATTSATFSGRRLEMLVNELDGELRHLHVEQVDTIRLAHQAREAGTGESRTVDGSAQESTASADDRSGTARRGDGGPAGATDDAGRAAAEEPEADPPRFYRLTLEDDVRVEQGRSATQRTATGDRLELIFSLESEGVGNVLTAGRTEDDVERSVASAGAIRPGVEAAVLTAAVGQTAGANEGERRWNPKDIAPTPHEMDTLIWCEGGLTITPLERMPEDLDSPKSAQLRLIGSPVRLHDAAEDARATCGLLLFQSPAGRLELLETEAHELKIDHPQLVATAERFWIERGRASRGGFTGAGAMEMESEARETAAGGPVMPRERLEIAWSDRVDFEFADDESTGVEAGPFSAIREAVFHGTVVAKSDDFRLIETGTAGPRSGQATTTEATGNVADAGRLRCERLEVRLSSTERAEGVRVGPRQILASGDVVADDARQMLWADELRVDLRADETGEASGDQTGAEEEPADDAVERVFARGGVQLLASRGERVFADELSVDAHARTAELRGGEVLLVDGPNIIDQVAVITVDDAAGEYRLEGPGRFRRFAQPLIGGGRERADVPSGSAAGVDEELRITWRDGVVVSGADADAPEGGGEPRLVRFAGDVQVLSPELRLQHADQMTAFLAATDGTGGDGGEDGSRLEAIEATGRVVARSAGEPGEIRGETVRIELVETNEGATIPEQLLARGNVMLTDAVQTIWCDDLAAEFVAAGEDDSGGGDDAAALADDALADEFTSARVSVTEFRATGNVQVALPDGERVFASSLTGDQQAGTALLTGAPVIIAGDDFILDEAVRLELDRTAGTYAVLGPGRFRSFAQRFDLGGSDRQIEPPAPDERVSLLAQWRERADYSTNDDATGRLDLRGEVRVVSEPTERELNTVSADRLDLVFGPEADAPAASADATARAVGATGGGEDDGLFASGGRELIEFTARGDATIESRTWLNADRSDEPRVFSISGQHVTHNQRAQTARVLGRGQLVIRDEWVDEVDADAEAAGGADDEELMQSVSAKGITAFRWSNALELEPLVDDLISVSMQGDVEYLHRDVDGGTTTITGQEIEATLRQRGGGADEMKVAAGVDRPIEPGALEIGGNLDLQRLYASGSLFVRTPQHDVACDTFDYDLSTGMALVSARPGRTVSVLSKDSGRPLRAQSVLWDMRKDSITISRGRGGGRP